MDDIGRYIWTAAGFVLLVLIAMFFSAAATAVASLSGSTLKRLAEEEEDEKAQKLYAIKKKQFDFSLYAGAATITLLIAAALISTGTFVHAVQTLWLSEADAWAKGLGTAGVILFEWVILVTFGYLFPKKLVSYHAESFGYFMLRLLPVLGGIMRAVVWPLTALTRLFVRMAGHDPNKAAEGISEEDIRLMVDTGNEMGTIEMSEREMINNVFEFDDRTVDAVMTHRTEICAARIDQSLSDVLSLVIEEGFSRIPIYKDDIDDIVGVVYAKDLLCFVGDCDFSNKPLAEHMHSVIYVPESTRCRMLFKQFKESKQHMAVIVDEYGGTAGIATMEDLIESIVGDIQDEYDSEEEEIARLEDGSISFDGGVSIEKVEELFDIDLDADEDTDTLGGLVINLLGRIPEDGEQPSVTVDGVLFAVTKIEERRIVRILAQRVPEEETTQEEA